MLRQVLDAPYRRVQAQRRTGGGMTGEQMPLSLRWPIRCSAYGGTGHYEWEPWPDKVNRRRPECPSSGGTGVQWARGGSAHELPVRFALGFEAVILLDKEGS